MEDSVRLNLIGITYNQIENGVYALIMEEPVSKRRLAIVIGYPEAQSIECKLQNVKTPRPLTHDLLASMLEVLNVKLVRVDIHKLTSGPYAGILSLENTNGEILFLDARSSDAVALAIRVNAPIYAPKSLIEKEGFSPRVAKKVQNEDVTKEQTLQSNIGIKQDVSPELKYRNYSLKQLESTLVKLVNEENYEEAAKVKSEIDRRQNSQD